jgi:mycofactocin precursor
MTERASTSPSTALSPPQDQGRASTPADSANPALVEEELLVEDVSIDGMCGVY